MPTQRVACDDGHPLQRWDGFYLARNWRPGLQCQKCNKPVRWFGYWNSPKGKSSEARTPYEVKFVARFREG